MEVKPCECGSWAINTDTDKKTCDVCYWKNKYYELLEEIIEDLNAMENKI